MNKIVIKYIANLVENKNVPLEKLLVLTPNSILATESKKQMKFNASGALNITTFLRFAQSEIKNYYPLILKNCNLIKKQDIVPVFLNFETSQYLITKVLERHRERGSIFAGIATSHHRIAADIGTNLYRAALAQIPSDEIGTRLYEALEFKDIIRKQHFEDMDSIIDKYKNKCFEIGVFDRGISIEIFEKYLLNDRNYINSLASRIEYIIVENGQELSPLEIEVILKLKSHGVKELVFIDKKKSLGMDEYRSLVYLQSKLTQHFQLIDVNNIVINIETEKNKNIYDSMSNVNIYHVNWSDLDKKDLINVEKSIICNEFQKQSKIQVFFENPLELRSEMLEEIAEKVIYLIEQGYKPNEITIITTYADVVAFYVLEKNLLEKGIKLLNNGVSGSLIENKLTSAIVTFAKLCHPELGITPTYEQIKELIECLFSIDSYRSSILAGLITESKSFPSFPDLTAKQISSSIGFSNIEKYQTIRNWMDEYNLQIKLRTDVFIQQVFMEHFIDVLDLGETFICDISKNKQEMSTTNDISHIKTLFGVASSFCESAQRFGMDASKEFMSLLQSGIKISEETRITDEKYEEISVILTTPAKFLSSEKTSKVVILSGISSDNWRKRIVRELTNPRVINADWDKGLVYTEEMETRNSEKYLHSTIRAIMEKCEEKIYTFESDLSQNGFENDSEVSKSIKELIIGLNNDENRVDRN